jgi:hypothetical protein
MAKLQPIKEVPKTTVSAKVSELDAELLKEYGSGSVSRGFRLILDSVRNEMQFIVNNAKKEEEQTKEKRNENE